MWDWIGEALLYQYAGLHHVLGGGPMSPAKEGQLEELLDDTLSRAFVRAVPTIVERLMRFERTVTNEPPNESVSAYFEEAVHCHVLGLSSASVALARSCLEQALRDTIRLPHAAGLSLDSLISETVPTKALDATHQRWARDIQQVANKVMHREGCTDDQALGVIVKLRAIVSKLYSQVSNA
jgi:hypothetical protein